MENSESWCSRQIPKGKIISKFAWQVLATLCILILIQSIVAHEDRWWDLTFQNGCENEFHLVVDVRSGMCYSSTAVGTSFTECLSWEKEEVWEEIDSVTGRNTQRDAKYYFPIIGILLSILLGIAALQVILCLLSLRHPESMKGKFRQYFLTALLVCYLLIAVGVELVGSDTDVTRTSTWKNYHDCTDTASYPLTAFWANVMAKIFCIIALIIVLYPAKFWCFQFISPQEQRVVREDDKEIAMVSLSRHPSIQYEEVVVEETASPGGAPTSAEDDVVDRNVELLLESLHVNAAIDLSGPNADKVEPKVETPRYDPILLNRDNSTDSEDQCIIEVLEEACAEI